MEYNLWCDKCGGDRPFQIRPWQTSAGRFDALSVGCDGCDQLIILEIRKGVKLKMQGPEEVE